MCCVRRGSRRRRRDAILRFWIFDSCIWHRGKLGWTAITAMHPIAALIRRLWSSPRRSPRSRRFALESLERRRLLAVTASFNAGTLNVQITGTDTAVITEGLGANGTPSVEVKDSTGSVVFSGPQASTVTAIAVTPLGTADVTDLTQVGASPDFTSLATVDVSSGTGAQVLLSGTIDASSDQTYASAVTLEGATTLASTTGKITFGTTVDGAFNLSTTSTGANFDGAVGSATPLASLSVSGAADLNAGLIHTTGSQFYQSAVTLSTDTTLVSDSGQVQFLNTVDGPFSLSTSAVGTLFDGNVGATTPLSSLSVSGTGSTLLRTNINTTGSQTYQQAVELAANASLSTSGGNVTFAKTIDGNPDVRVGFNLTIDTTGGRASGPFGQTQFNGSVGGTAPLSTLTVTTGGPLNISHAITTTGNILLEVVAPSAPAQGPAPMLSVAGALTSTGGSVELRAGGNLTIAAGSSITAASATLRGDFNNQATSGGTILLAGNINAATVAVFTGDNNDVVNVATTLANTSTTINTGAGTDSINVSSAVPNLSGVLTTIAGAIAINGGTGTTALNLGDGADATQGDSGTITSTAITGLGMLSGITYANLGAITVTLPTGTTFAPNVQGHRLGIQSTPAATAVSVTGGALVVVGDGVDTLDQILGPVSVSGANALVVADYQETTGHTYDVTGTSITRTSVSSMAISTAVASDPPTVTYSNVQELTLLGALPDSTFNVFLPLAPGQVVFINGGSGTDNDLNVIGSNSATNNATVANVGSGDPIQAQNIQCLTMYGAPNQSNIFVNQTSIPSILIGGLENDTLIGGSGPDVLFGGAGNDLLVAGGAATGTDFTFADMLPAYLPNGMINPNVTNAAVYPGLPGTKIISGGGGVVVYFNPGTVVVDASSVTFMECDLPGSRALLQSIFNSALASNECLATLTSPPAAPKTTASLAEVESFSPYVNQAFEDVFGRPADNAALAYWSGQLASGISPGAFAAALTHSQEYYQRFVQATYEQYFGRAADAAGLSFWTGQLQAGLSDAAFEADLIGSAEFYARSGGTDQAWVDALYQNVLGRPADQQGQNYWISQIQSGVSRTAVAYGFLTSAEHEAQVITDDYQHYLNRSPNAAEINYWLGQFQGGATNEDLIAGFLSSAEYIARAG
jgi:hypothetical protein